jgi:PFU (PLAA family ubiquitin binding)
VFASAEERHADADTVAQVEGTLAERLAAAKAKPAAESTGVPEDQIKPESALLMPGAKSHEHLFVRKGDGKVWAHTWNAEACEWDVLGEVMGGPAPSGDTMETPSKARSRRRFAHACEACGLSCVVCAIAREAQDHIACGFRPALIVRELGKHAMRFHIPSERTHSAQWYNGQEWDFLFHVDADGTDLKLPMNRGEDVYDVADRFMSEHNLPASYQEKIVAFILENAGDAGAAPPRLCLLLTRVVHHVPSTDGGSVCWVA